MYTEEQKSFTCSNLHTKLCMLTFFICFLNTAQIKYYPGSCGVKVYIMYKLIAKTIEHIRTGEKKNYHIPILHLFEAYLGKIWGKNCGQLWAGKELTCQPAIPGVQLMTLVSKLRQGGSDTPQPKSSSRRRLLMEEPVSQDAIDLLQRLLELNPNSRITAAEALEHTYFQDS